MYSTVAGTPQPEAFEIVIVISSSSNESSKVNVGLASVEPVSGVNAVAVSYTHLTLPTIYSV